VCVDRVTVQEEQEAQQHVLKEFVESFKVKDVMDGTTFVRGERIAPKSCS
jgi:hypothetical protein